MARQTIVGGADGELGSLIYEKILADMRDGVATIDLQGRIITFNAAAGRILGLDPQATVGQSFGEVFLMEESFDDFNEVVLKAVYENEATHSREVSVTVGGHRVDLHVTSTFLMLERDGAPERQGVIVVFSDITEQRKRRKLKRLFGEYVDPRIVERILDRGGVEDLKGARQVMTVSFADLRDFTGWSERLDPESLVSVLNRFLTAMTIPIGAAGGITDKFIGDAVMACWGPPFTEAGEQAIDACNAALGQIESLPALRRELAESGVARAEAIDVAIGIGTGEVIVGDIGAEQSRNFTVIGNAVNVAARLQEAAKRYGQRVLVAHDTRAAAGDGFVFRMVDHATLRGRSSIEPIHALVGRVGSVSDDERRLIEQHERGVMALVQGLPDTAAERFRACLEMAPGDRPAAVLLERCLAYEDESGAGGGSGVASVPGAAAAPK
ncbi:adenylate/guanylate cyclase domain-containing protein [Pseudoxanthobacter sp. M-2]